MLNFRVIAHMLAVVCVFILAAQNNAFAQRPPVLVQKESYKRCKTITAKQQLVLERRALGGDQRAQYVIATCAWPNDPIKKNGEVKRAIDWIKQESSQEDFKKRVLYTYKWATLAYCDRRFNDFDAQTAELIKENRIFKRYEPSSDLRETARKQQEEEEARLQNIRKEVNDELYLFFSDSPAQASREFVGQMEGLGANGLITLALMRDCPTYPDFEQKHSRLAIWSIARDEYADAFRLGTAQTVDDPIDFPKAYVENLEKFLSDEDKRFVDLFKTDYGLFDLSQALVQVSDAAALGRMGEVPVQYLQLALGAFRYSTAFRRGYRLDAFSIDNVYGEKTSKLVKKAQSNFCVIRDVAIYEDALRDVTKRADQGEAKKNLPLFARDDDCSPVLARKDDKVSSYMSTRGKRENGRVKKPDETGPKDYPTGWLSPLQSRALICRAAVVRNDPYSYLHLAQMFAEGFGYPVNYDKALFATQRAQRLFDLGPPRHSSNHRDLRKSALEKDYKLQAAELEEEVYRKAAIELLGAQAASGGTVDSSIKNRINARIANANYDETGKLCADEVWGYWDTTRPRLPRDSKQKVTPADELPPPADEEDENGDEQAALTFEERASLPVFVSVDAPVTLNATQTDTLAPGAKQ